MGGFIGSLNFTNNGNSLSIENSYSVGVVTASGFTTTNGGFVGYMNHGGGISFTITVTNCAWYTGSYSHAIGTDSASGTNKSLNDLSYGTDESDNTAFYSKEHTVYAQGT